MFTFITLPGNFASDTLGLSGSLVTDLSPYLVLVIGTLLGVLIVLAIISALHHK